MCYYLGEVFSGVGVSKALEYLWEACLVAAPLDPASLLGKAGWPCAGGLRVVSWNLVVSSAMPLLCGHGNDKH